MSQNEKKEKEKRDSIIKNQNSDSIFWKSSQNLIEFYLLNDKKTEENKSPLEWFLSATRAWGAWCNDANWPLNLKATLERMTSNNDDCKMMHGVSPC